MKPSDMACVVLASGNSKRFGARDKLAADLCGKSLVDHVLETVKSIGFGEIFLVTQDVSRPHVTTVINSDSHAGHGHALRLGFRAAQAAGWDCVTVVLGDMPLIEASHLRKMLKKLNQGQAVLSVFGDVKMPPAMFKGTAVSLILQDESGASMRTIIRRLDAIVVPMSQEESLDVDTPEDLTRIANIMRARTT